MNTPNSEKFLISHDTLSRGAAGQDRFADLVQGLDAIVWEMDAATWTFTFVNRRAEEILGYPVERWLHEPGFWQDVVLHPDDREWALDFCGSATRDARDHEFEYRALRADGGSVWLRDMVHVVRGEGGEARLLRGVMIDITRQKQAERRLQERERQLAEAQHLAHLGSWAWAVGSDVVEWSDVLYQIFGVQPGAPVGYESYLKLIHPDDRERVADTVRQALETRQGYLLEHRIVRPDGLVRHVFSEGDVETDADGRPLRIFGIAQDITERREAVERSHLLALEQVARREAEAARKQVQRILESITDAFFALDREWRFTYVNEEAEALLQRSREELLGKGIWDEFPDAVGSTFHAMYRRAVDEQRTMQFQEFFPPLDTWFEVRAYPSEDGLSVYFRDINERIVAEAALRHQGELTQTITDNATAAMFMMDTRGHCTFMNPAAEQMTGFTLDEIRDIPLHDAIHHLHPDGTPYPMSECPIDRALPENNDVRAHEDVFIRKNGEFFPVTCAARPIIRDGVPIGTVVEVRDMSAEKAAQQALRTSEERYRSLIEATAAIVWNTPASGEFGGEQPGWRAFTRQSPEEYENWGWLDAIHPDDRDETVQAWQRALASRTTYEAEHRVCRHDHEYRHMLARAVPITEASGEIREWIGIHTDITERKSLEERQRFLLDVGALLSSSLDYETTLASVAELAVPTLADWCAIDLLDEDGRIHRVEVAHTDPSKRELARELEQRYPVDPGAETGVPQVLRTGEPELIPEIPAELIESTAQDEEHLRIIRELGLRSYIVVPLLARGRTLGAISLVTAESGRRYGAGDLETAQELALRAAFAVDNARLVTELHRTLENLRASEESYRFLAESIPQLVWTTTAEGYHDYFNDRWFEYTGMPRQGRQGWNWKHFLHPDDYERTLEVWNRSLSTGDPYQVEYRLRRAADGQFRWFLGRAVALRDAEGDIVRWFGTCTDIHDQKEAEAERDRLIAELGMERARLSNIFMEAPAFIATLRGPEHVFEMANPPYFQLIGGRDVIGKPVHEALPEIEGQGFFELLDEVYRSGEPFVGNEAKVMVQRSQGSPLEERFVNFVYQPILGTDDSVTGIFVHGVDVSTQVWARQEVERKAEELARLAAALERSNKELDQFAYVTSHDLKAPLRGIANLAQWIEEDLAGEVPEEVREHLDLLKGRVHRMEGLIDGILQYSRAGRVRSELVEVDTGALVHEVVDLLDPPESLSIELSPDLPTLTTERLPLQQVFMNLVGNAVKYVGRADGRIRVNARKSHEAYEFSVSDDGPGIAPEYHERIFGIFQTLEARDKVEGTGIGLSLVKKIVEHRGGRVWVESGEGAGATFRFTWPA
jgi:PAS domain S-box-containing protein